MEEQDWDDTPIAAEAQRAAQILTPHALKLPRPERPRRLAISNQKGGVGKTTTTVNLAAGLARNGLKILVVDLDPQGNASTALGVEHREGTVSSYELLLGACTPEQVIQRSTANGNLFCIPATIDLAAVEIELVSKVRREYRLRDALSPEFIKEAGFDYVFVDCPPSLGLLTTNALNAVEEVLIPIQCEYYALEGVNQLLKYITMVQHQLNPQLHISAILLTMFDGRTKLAEEVSADVRNTFGALVLRNRIPRSVKVSEAPGFGQTVLDYDPGSRGSMAYMDAAKELANRGDVRFVK
ncbi:MAG: ParA family protein [Corynebacterium matruchotii]|jgi:sporulation initiation inhibitor protein Soj|uniref:CobQ/CobB/MinD/ParA nucleotide binding domain protein n=3 Tax=Corynebacterium matruchotii TaxID=43768 RepID=E0DHF4_9CORY|nr:ParA family protein [Corynebacterium matruchotii]RKW23752.1 MAG: ParA family protein [Corynebacterium sp.]EEG27547.1 CobQ/CobB/MinD/ParA nucleotide binding domain protein [Corynebacterium matruchotii ATCC 33806]EFM48323.1 CobQ/CobB/MinD/ParA nucleotide binding domain protein [Corynebacterium matruchotii ATCC 14266]KAB1922977.1 ParA family protein [Corynebacterium matruchotii]QIP45299.1 ParA family protein [Corynebacterium matruchotii]